MAARAFNMAGTVGEEQHMRGGTSMVKGRRQELDRRIHHESTSRMQNERPVQVIGAPLVRGPLPVKGNPSMVRYEVVARLRLPAADSPAAPCISFAESPGRGKYVDVRWTTTDCAEPRGTWERKTSITLPIQFAVRSYTVTESASPHEREARD